MDTLSPYIWLIALTVGVLLLGGAMAYGTMRNRNRTLSERVTSEVETKRIYEAEDRDKS